VRYDARHNIMNVSTGVKGRAATLLIFPGAMWVIRCLDAITPVRMSVAGHGVVPRTWDGLFGILTAPLIHVNFAHLIANTVPFIVLSAVVLMRGVSEYLFVVLITALSSGLGTWLFGASNTEHVGASGVILGLMGYVLFRAVFDRHLMSAVIMLGVAAWYGTAIAWAFIPRTDISWTGHFFGFVGGYVAARLLYSGRGAARGEIATSA
jgi:membrane associated rhomboid family serine protease